MEVKVNEKDELVMRLVHYFVTEENYEPIVVNGVKNEIWLENSEAPYKIIRINSNYIHNIDQLNFDNYKIKNIIKQIRKKTLSLKINTLNILLDLNDSVKIKEEKDIETFYVKSKKDIKENNVITSFFPNIKKLGETNENTLDFIINVTNEINEKTERNNEEYEEIFKPKKIILTKILIMINIAVFVLSMVYPKIFNLFILHPDLVTKGEYFRLLTSSFLHADIMHLLVNMYSLNIIGNQIETFLGKRKFLAIYFGSAITSSLMSAVVTKGYSVGASGALFGLLGALVYFGFNYRIYFGTVLRSQILPVIALNLFIGFLIPSIDNAGHIGGLIGGLFLAMIAGVNSKKDKITKINGIILTVIYILFLVYMLFIK